MKKVTIGILVVIIAITSWPTLTRIVRDFLSLREQEFVLGARAIGASDSELFSGILSRTPLVRLLLTQH